MKSMAKIPCMIIKKMHKSLYIYFQLMHRAQSKQVRNWLQKQYLTDWRTINA